MKISGGNVDEEDGGYLKMGGAYNNNKYLYSAFFKIIQSAVYRNWEDWKIVGLVTFVQSNMKPEKPYAYCKICGVYRAIKFDCMHYFQPN